MTSASNDNKNPDISGMVLCAGLGTRMLPLTLSTPKPLINVAGKPLIGHAVKQLENAGIENIIVNVHYLADQVETWVREHDNPAIKISDEREELLETGGGVLKARGLLGSSPFFVLNSDAFWIDQSNLAPGDSTLEKMRAGFNPDECDFLLLLARHEAAVGFDGNGDFFCSNDGRLKRRGDADQAPFIFAGCYLAHPRVLDNSPSGAFSMNVLWDRSLAAGRVWGIVHDGLWLHVGTPDAIGAAEDAIEKFRATNNEH